MAYKVKELREAMQMTQEELSSKAGVSRATISGIENGTERNTSSKTLLQIARALNTTIGELFAAESV